MTRRQTITHSCPEIGEEEIAALAECARSLQVKGEDRVKRLEVRIAGDQGYAGAVATTTGGHAIHLALRSKFKEGKARVAIPSYVCRSLYDAICQARCFPLLFDVSPTTLSLDLEAVARLEPDAVVLPHMFGIRAPVDEFVGRGMWVIEDCAQRIDLIDEKSDLGKAQVRIFSFEGTKLLTSGEGGMLLSDDEELLDFSRKLRDAPYDFREPALHLPLTDLQAAMAYVQWEKLPQFIKRRIYLGKRYLEAIGNDFAERVHPGMFLDSTIYFRFLLKVGEPDAFMEAAAEDGVIIRRPIAPQPLHTLFGAAGDFRVTEDMFAHLVSMPLYPHLTDEEAAAVESSVLKILSMGA